MPDFMPYASFSNVNSPIYAGGKLAGNAFAAQPPVTAGGLTFENVLNDAIANVEELQAVKSADSYNLALGDMDNIGTMMINSQRADASLSMIIELRDRFLEGYNEIMRTSI